MILRALMMALFLAVSTTAAHGFGMIAISDNGAFGWSLNYLEYASALDEALIACKKNGGEDCYVPTTTNKLEMHAVPYMHMYVARSGVTTQKMQIVGLGYDFEENNARKIALMNCKNLSQGQWVVKNQRHINAPSTCKIMKKMYNKK